jgi:hypothetical protein
MSITRKILERVYEANNQDINSLKKEQAAILKKLDAISDEGGKVLQYDPLMLKLKAIRRKLAAANNATFKN